jgi:hypothetical protein
MHYMGHGESVELAKSLHTALAESKTPLDKPAPPAPAAEPPAFVKIIEDTLGTKGRFAGGVLSFGIPRGGAITDHEMTLTTLQGVAAAINFQEAGTGKVATTGDFVLTAEEVNPVISTLEEHDLRSRRCTATCLQSSLACFSCTSGPWVAQNRSPQVSKRH